MKKYCSECGFSIGEEFKFCPNCGTSVEALFDVSDKNEKVREVIICKNCGEENPAESLNCFSCGISLKGNKGKRQTSGVLENKTVRQKKNITKVTETREEEKVLDNKKILMISSFVVIVFIAVLLISGVFDSGIQNNPGQMNNQSNSGVSLTNLEEINELENKIKADPDDMESTLHLAHLLQDSELFERAIINYKKYLEKNPENADVRVDMGICFYNLGDYAAAINEIENALKYQPKHQIAHLNLGIVNLTAQNIDVSKEWFRKAVELDPQSEAGKRAQELLNSH